MQKRQTGFTLIELVFVIALIGILAAVAIPKFAAFQADARLAKMKAGMGAVKAAAAMAHAVLITRGFDGGYTGSPGIVIEGTNVIYTNGYPDAASVVALAGLTTDYTITGLTAPRIAAADSNHTGTGGTSDCTIAYTPAAAANQQPTYAVNATLEMCN